MQIFTTSGTCMYVREKMNLEGMEVWEWKISTNSSTSMFAAAPGRQRFSWTWQISYKRKLNPTTYRNILVSIRGGDLDLGMCLASPLLCLGDSRDPPDHGKSS